MVQWVKNLTAVAWVAVVGSIPCPAQWVKGPRVAEAMQLKFCGNPVLSKSISTICWASRTLQGLFKEIELKASGQDKNDQTLIIAPPVSL